ncbi:hypothetical protein LTR85_005840 [Meristemomyces frigidus]|nr:hypothetical protein LTR85_005840 [Meristemomyces frigidus]
MGATVGVGVGIGSQGLSVSLGASLGLDLSATLGLGATLGLPGFGGGSGGASTTSSNALPASSGSTPSRIVTVIPVTTVQSTTTITSCTTALGGALTCAGIPLLATLSTTSNTGHRQHELKPIDFFSQLEAKLILVVLGNITSIELQPILKLLNGDGFGKQHQQPYK